MSPRLSGDVSVLGAGVTGLTVALELLRAGREVTIYESAPGAGGLAGSFRRDGYAFDFGPHEFQTDDSRLVALLESVCGADLLVVEKRAAQWFGGRFVDYPFRPFDVLKSLGPRISARVIAEIGWRRARRLVRPYAMDDFAAWTRANFGDTLYARYFGPYTRKVWGGDPAELDPSTASARIATTSLRDLVRKSLRYHLFGAEDFESVHGELQRTFRYTRGGIGTLQERLREHVERLGGRFAFGHRVAGIEVHDRLAHRLHFEHGRSVDCSSVVSTIPLPALLRATLGDAATPILARTPLPFRGMVFVFLRIAVPRLSPNHWIYFPDPDIPFQRATDFGNFGADMAPPGCTGVTLEVAADPEDAVWQRDDATIVADCVAALARLDLLDPHVVLGADVVRVRHAYPRQIRGYRQHTDALLRALSATVANVVTLGRQGLFRYCNMNECMEMAIDAAPAIAADDFGAGPRSHEAWRGVGIVG